MAMDTVVEDVMEKDPITVSSERDRPSVVALMKKNDLLQLPVLDPEGKVVGLEVMQNLVYEAKKENSVLLMVGGFGKRLLPLTRDIPKPLLKVGRKPLLESIVEQLVEAGFSSIFMAVHYKAELVCEYFGDGRDWGVNISYLKESEPLGTAGALSLVETQNLTKPLLVMNGDLLTRLDFGQLLEFHDARGGQATMCVRECDFQIPYGVVHCDGERVSSIVEKPIQTFFVSAGIYVLEPGIIPNGVGAKKYRDMPDLMCEIVDSGGVVNMFPIHEYWLDIGRIEEYKRAQKEVAEFTP
jgi:NDP-sugar pyrophosphorylase family protein